MSPTIPVGATLKEANVTKNHIILGYFTNRSTVRSHRFPPLQGLKTSETIDNGQWTMDN
ncbi:hypothetical protein A5482_004365 [Cyanobacterium sp. IPPAS B-1200]|uniref:hypothetical protein n=1 Tax=Cyanobacterium sp. IPPAS B-1200 TaxID=1562720 RepID=UPI00137254D9|nr:hypothetical protein [Cyanobacterium sp. IPPAS B-1200]